MFMHTQTLRHKLAARRNPQPFIHPFPTMERPVDECVTVVMHWTNMDPGVLMFAIHFMAMPSVRTHPFVRRTGMCGYF